MADCQRNLQVGDRISVKNSIATIRFCGQLLGTSVPKKEETWLGVEWDDPTRGKNNGAVKGTNGEAIQFFKVKSNNGGSFLRLSSLSSDVTTPTSLLEALKQRYDRKLNEEAIQEFVSPPPPSPNLKYDEKFEFCPLKEGEGEGMGEGGHGKRVDLGDCGIHEIDNPTSLSLSSLSIVEELDLTGNLLSSWTDILPLFYFDYSNNNDTKSKDNTNPPLKNLRTLNLRHNRLSSSSSLLSLPSPLPSPSLLRIIILNHNQISRDILQNLGKSTIFQGVEELHLAFNQLSEEGEEKAEKEEKAENQENREKLGKQLGLSPSFFPHLKVLDLTENSFSSWSFLLSLSLFPSLETLYLSSNNLPDLPSSLPTTIFSKNIENFEFDEFGKPKNKKRENFVFFPSLQTLTLDQNNLSCLFSLQFFSLFPSLLTLRIANQTGNLPEPRWLGIRSKAPLTVRQICVALLPQILNLNGSIIESKETIEAQKYFLKWFSSSLYTSSSSSSPSSFAFPPSFSSLSSSLPAVSPFLLSRILSLTRTAISANGPPPPPTTDPSSFLSSTLLSFTLQLQLPHLPAPLSKTLSLPPTTTFTDLLGYVENMREEEGKGEKEALSLFLQAKEEGEGEGGRDGLIQRIEEIGATLEYYALKNGDLIIVRPSMFG